MTDHQRSAAALRARAARPARRDTVADTCPTVDCDLAWIAPGGIVIRDRRALPDVAPIATAVSSFARGTLLRGPDGEIAIEDLVPGDRVTVRGGTMVRIAWIGARTFAGGTDRPILYRVAAGAFGASGPQQDVLLGAHAHILIDSPRCRDLVGGRLAFAPLAAFEDGHAVTALAPPGVVTVYGIACSAQEAVLAAGLPVESYHAERTLERELTRSLVADRERLLPPVPGSGDRGAERIPCLSFQEAQALALAGF